MDQLKEELRLALREIYTTSYEMRQPETYLTRDVIFYAWLLQTQTKGSKGPIDSDLWTALCCTQSRDALSIPIYYWWKRGFFVKERYKKGEYVLTSEALQAIEAVFNEPEFGYYVSQPLPGNKITPVQFIKYINHLEPDPPDLAQIIAAGFKASYRDLGYLPITIDDPDIRKKMFICDIRSGAWQFWLAVVHSNGTLTSQEYRDAAYILFEAVANHFTQYVLLVYPSVDNTEGVANRINRQRVIFGMTELGSIRLLHVLNEAAQQKTLKRDLIEIFDPEAVASEKVMSFDYPPSFIISRLTQ